MTFTVRRLTRDDAADYRAIRLEALQDAPASFGDTYEDAKARPEPYWTALFEGERAIFGAFSGGTLVGIANFMPVADTVSAHRGLLLGMYVSASARGQECGRALVVAVLDHAEANGFLQVHLGVSTHNDAALRLYEAAGFAIYGTEPRGMMIAGAPIDRYLMVKFLDGYEWRR